MPAPSIRWDFLCRCDDEFLRRFEPQFAGSLESLDPGWTAWHRLRRGKCSLRIVPSLILILLFNTHRCPRAKATSCWIKTPCHAFLAATLTGAWGKAGASWGKWEDLGLAVQADSAPPHRQRLDRPELNYRKLAPNNCLPRYRPDTGLPNLMRRRSQLRGRMWRS